MLYLLISVSVACCLAYAVLLDPLRPNKPQWLAGFVRCPMCLGFWIGMGISYFTEYQLTVFYFDCWVTAFICFIIDVWYDK